jgi:flagellar basal body rod protein FlgG
MNYGLYLAAAAAVSDTRRIEVITNNLVNSNTTGFKPDMVIGRARLPERLESNAATEPHLLLERLGGSPTLNPTYVSVEQGALVKSGNELDAALEGQGFFVVRGPDGQPRLTRDGRFALNANGDLVTAAGGLPVLDETSRPIRLLRQSPVGIDQEGRIVQDGKVRAVLRVTPPVNALELVKVGGNLLRRGDGTIPAGLGTATVVQGHVEASTVDPVTTLKDLMNATRSMTAAVRMMQLQDQIMGQAINTMGRVA